MLAFLAAQPSLRADRQWLAQELFDPDELRTGPNLRLLLTRGVSSLASHADLTLLIATSENLALLESNVACDLRDFEKLSSRARSEKDPLAASVAWHDALKVARHKPLSDIDHPLLIPVRERIVGAVLDALVHLAGGPLGPQNAALILERLHEFELEQARDTIRVEQLMRIYAALGLKEEVVRTFTAYESHLDYECGEKVSCALTALLDSLLAGMDHPPHARWGVAPDRPQLTVGREETLRNLVQVLQSPQTPTRLTTLTGQSGIGKSHLLRALFWQLVPHVAAAHFDLEAQPAEVVGKLLQDCPCEVVLIDHVQAEHGPFVAQWLRSHPDTRFLCASQARLRLPDESLMTIGALEVGDPTFPGPAIELLERSLRHVHQNGDPTPDPGADRLLFELASLCDGIPLALEIAGRLGGSIGVRATISSLRRNLDALTNDRRDSNRKASLRNAIASSFQNLGSEAQRLVEFLAKLGARCHVDHLLECADAVPCDLEEGVLSGLVVREHKGTYVRVLRSTGALLRELGKPEPHAKQIALFRVRSVHWFQGKAAEVPLDLEIADSLPLSIEMANNLIEAGATEDAIRLFASIRPWLGSHHLAASQLERIDGALKGLTTEDLEKPEALLTLSAAYFHAGAYVQMRDTVSEALRSLQHANLSGDIRCQLKMQRGLAELVMGNPQGAILSYQQALSAADASVGEGTWVKCYYNLGTLLEAQERLKEALEAQEAASGHFSNETDPRVESLVNTCIGRLLYRLGGDLDSAGVILEATLAHARERHDMRAAAEILQNLGAIYWERQLFAKAAVTETTGTLLLLGFGYGDEFRRLSKSSFVTLCASLFELGLDDLAHATRTLIDRMGPQPLYAPNQILFDSLAAKTYAEPPGIHLGVAAETEVREHLRRCLAQLHEQDLPLGRQWDVANLLGAGFAPNAAANPNQPAASRAQR